MNNLGLSILTAIGYEWYSNVNVLSLPLRLADFMNLSFLASCRENVCPFYHFVCIIFLIVFKHDSKKRNHKHFFFNFITFRNDLRVK